VAKKTVRDVPTTGRTVLVRCDFNVPLDDQRVADDTRIRAHLPTIEYLIAQRARIVLCSHLGRPKGRTPALSLKPIATVLQELLQRPIQFCPDTIGPRARRAADSLLPGGILLLENTRFYPEEEKNDPAFARALAALADLYVNDAFSAAHRAHASTAGVAAFLPAVAGLLMEREIEMLSRLLDPEHPFVAIVGGAKVSDKLSVLGSLLQRVDRLLIGGGMANTFLAALDYHMGSSLVETAQLPAATEIVAEAGKRGVQLLLPVDLVVADYFLADPDRRTVDVGQVPPNWIAMDIGPVTAERFAAALPDARMIFWNGPLGVAEWPNFAHGTQQVARAVAGSRAFSVVGGGDSIAALNRLGMADRVGHISTGGGASLEFIEGKTLPGIAALQDR
jgi:phosphoglycerate kinase